MATMAGMKRGEWGRGREGKREEGNRRAKTGALFCDLELVKYMLKGGCQACQGTKHVPTSTPALTKNGYILQELERL